MAAATATIAAAGIAAGATVYATNKQSKAAKAAGGSDLYGSKVKVPEYEGVQDQINDADPDIALQKMQDMLPALRKYSRTMTKLKNRTRDDAAPGSSKVMREGMSALSSLLTGAVPTDVRDKIMRTVAEKGTGGSGPAYGGAGSNGDFDFNRMLGKVSTDNMKEGLSIAPTWLKLAEDFTFTPEKALASVLGMVNSQFQFAQLSQKEAENEYSAAMNEARGTAMPDPQVLGAYNDNIQRSSVEAEGIARSGDALGKLLLAAGQAVPKSSPSTVQTKTMYSSAGAVTHPVKV